jgi:hypothetical protein
MSWWIWLLIIVGVILYLGVGLLILDTLNWEGARIRWYERLAWMIAWPIFMIARTFGRC